MIVSPRLAGHWNSAHLEGVKSGTAVAFYGGIRYQKYPFARATYIHGDGLELMLSPEIIEEYNRVLNVPAGTSACPAASINLHFSQQGVVTACCFNRQQVLGVYPQNSVSEIWNGEPIRELREALQNNDLSLGCQKCEQQIEARDYGGAHALFYSYYGRITAEKRIERGMQPEGGPEAPPLPMRLEFNIHNSCNLECVMCHGLASSAIRTRRERLSPMPNPYDETFVDQLEPFLPYVVEADFMGGEPFLIPAYQMLWERIAVVNPKMELCILTNATILDDKIKALLERINCVMHISIDSMYKDTYEAIRKGASFELVMANCMYYLDLMKRKGRPFTWRYCPMRQNWKEIPETVKFCSEKGITLMYNQVDSPVNFSLHTLPVAELQEVINFYKQHIPAETTIEVEIENRKHFVELIQRLEGFLIAENRLNGLKARLDISNSVISQYSKGKDKTSKRVPVLVIGESTEYLVQAAKRYIATRINVDQARITELHLPEVITDRVSEQLADMTQLLVETDRAVFTKVFLNELTRTYSGVGGVSHVHDGDVFEWIGQFSVTLASHADQQRVITNLLTVTPGEIYELLASSQSAEAVTQAMLQRYAQSSDQRHELA
jgi:molybdenum cofactor biosynthesis enzyme MoaA